MVLHIKDFITDERNCTPDFVRVVEMLKDGDVLCLDGGKYQLFPDGARAETYYMSNNDGGVKPIAIPLINKRNVTVDGGGAELIFNGEILPIVIDGSENVCVRNLSIDYAEPMYAQCEIAEVDGDRAVLKFDGDEFNCRVDSDGHFCFYSKKCGWEYHRTRGLALEFDREGKPSAYSYPFFPYCGEPADHGFLGGMFKDVKLRELDENLIEMRGEFGLSKLTAGNYLVMTYAGREFPGIFANESKNVSICGVRLYQTISMGIIMQTSANILLDGVVAEPRENSGRILSTGADSTHFVNCRGKIEIAGCKFVKMMDDAVNIHGNYHLYKERKVPDTLILKVGHFQQQGVQTYRVGDEVAVIDSTTNEVKLIANVLEAELVDLTTIRLRLDRTVDEPGEYWVTENLSTAPEVYIHDTESGYNRPRGFLLSSRGKTLVERCKFYNMEQGIQLSGEMCDWYESGAALDVTIRDNDFTNSAYFNGVAILSRPLLRATQYNKDIIYSGRLVVENNLFSQSDKRIMTVEHAQHVIFRNNTFKKDETLAYHGRNGENGITCAHCGTVEIEDVKDI